MAKIVTITNPLTGQPAQVDQLDHTAQQIDDGLNIARGVSNPNLLDNWYFGNPVNQRGNSYYDGSAEYSIDRWWLQYNSRIELVSGGIKFSGQWNFRQRMETLPKGTYTFSVLYDQKVGSDTIRAIIGRNAGSDIAFSEGSKVSDLVSCTVESDSISSVSISFAGSTDNSARIIAAKLELGSRQTLAHQENGNWVLNEIPDYGEQLRRCQYYSRFFGGDIEIPCGNNSAGTYIEGTLPLTMRSGSGSISYSEGFLFTGNGTFYTVTSANVSSNGGRVKIGVNVSGQLSGNLQATLFLKNCSILFDL